MGGVRQQFSTAAEVLLARDQRVGGRVGGLHASAGEQIEHLARAQALAGLEGRFGAPA
jgi:hypothetical protein